MSTAVRNAEITADLFAGASEMHERCREADWAATPLGAVSGWSQSLRTTASIVLASRHPMFLSPVGVVYLRVSDPRVGTTRRGWMGGCARAMSRLATCCSASA